MKIQTHQIPVLPTKLRRAFTLVEMLLVVTIIGILAALVIPKIVGRSEQARTTAAHADISSIKTALDAFEVDNGFYPKSIQDLVVAPSNARNWLIMSGRPSHHHNAPSAGAANRAIDASADRLVSSRRRAASRIVGSAIIAVPISP